MFTVIVDVNDLCEIVVVNDWEGQCELLATPWTGIKQVRLWTDRCIDRRNDLFTDGVERGVRDLGKELFEIVEQ